MANEKFTAKKIAVLAVFTAASLIMFLIENLLPTVVPGAKIGLANLFTLAALIMYSPVEAFSIVLVRTLLGSLFSGNISAMIYSTTGGAVSMAVACVLLYSAFPKISVMAISIISAVAHNVTQNLVFCAVSGMSIAINYMPYLLLLGVASGAIIGAIVTVTFKKIPLTQFERVVANKLK